MVLCTVAALAIPPGLVGVGPVVLPKGKKDEGGLYGVVPVGVVPVGEKPPPDGGDDGAGPQVPLLQ